MTLKLQQALDALYAAFSSIRRPRVIDPCPGGSEGTEIAALLARPLRELPPEELSSYTTSVLLIAVGVTEELRYFIPRILEISATHPHWWPDPAVVARALTEAGWREWPLAQREAIARVWDERLTELIEAAEDAELNSWLCGSACAGLDLTPALAHLSRHPATVLALYAWHANEIVDHRLANGFWAQAPQARQQMIDWFHSPEISRSILDSYGVDLNSPRQ